MSVIDLVTVCLTLFLNFVDKQCTYAIMHCHLAKRIQVLLYEDETLHTSQLGIMKENITHQGTLMIVQRLFIDTQ